MYPAASTPAVGLAAADLAALVERVVITGEVSDAERIDRIRQLEALKSACAAAQALETVLLLAAQAAPEGSSRRRQDQARRSTTAQVALARKVSPTMGGRCLGLATALTREMPHTFRALAAGQISEWRAILVARETALLSREHRLIVDRDLGDRLTSLGDKQVAGEAMKLAYKLDADQAVKRHDKAVTERRVTVRPAAEGMAYLTALLPLAPAVAAYAALNTQAATAKATGDARGRGQLMADELMHRLVTPAAAAAAGTSSETADVSTVPTGVDVSIQLVMTDRTLLDGDSEPAVITGFGAIPAPLARRIARGSEKTRVWVRRLYAHAGTGQLAAMDSSRRLFPAALREFLITRDQVCGTSWCEAPIRHADHVTSVADGGRTHVDNGKGRCEFCNYVKETPGWRSVGERDGSVITTVPTGHTYWSQPIPPPRSRPWADLVTVMEGRAGAIVVELGDYSSVA